MSGITCLLIVCILSVLMCLRTDNIIDNYLVRVGYTYNL